MRSFYVLYVKNLYKQKLCELLLYVQTEIVRIIRDLKRLFKLHNFLIKARRSKLFEQG
jgi:hypothetical protein